MYSPTAATVVAHNPLTHEWNNSLYSWKESNEIEGKFDDDDANDGDGDNQNTKIAESKQVEESLGHDQAFAISDEALVEADMQGEQFLTIE